MNCPQCDALDRIDALIAETLKWKEDNRAAGREVEALACSIRIRALKDAKKAIEKEPGDAKA